MRAAFALVLGLSIIACSSTSVRTPREYLDEQTAATITVVKEPWIFTREVSTASEQRDYLHLYAIDVNRMGNHRQYVAVLQSTPTQGGSAPSLELTTAERIVALEATTAEPRELGIAQPIVESYTMTAAWWYFPVDKEQLASLANSSELQARLKVGDQRIPYVLWRDGRNELSELTAVLP
jgi:hypothetical protein